MICSVHDKFNACCYLTELSDYQLITNVVTIIIIYDLKLINIKHYN